MKATQSYSVIIPAFDAARTIRAAISSVLAQTVPPDAIVVINDGSTDGTAALVEGFGDRVTLINQSNQGPAAATDRGLAAVRTSMIAGLDADDVWFPDKAERQLDLLSNRPDLQGVFCRAVAFNHGDEPDPAGAARDAWSRSTMMIRRTAVERMGPILDRENARGLGEMIRWFDAGRRCGLKFEMMPDALAGRRIIEGSLSFARDPRAFLPLIRRKLADRP